MYIIQEIQTTSGVATLLPPVIYTDSNEADSAYYAKLSAAAISQIETHTIMMHDEYGNIYRVDWYSHQA